jgi:hypothetical protein
MAERRLLRALTCAADLRIISRRQLITNLPAGVPMWRPFFSSSAALFGGFIPSGLIPGDVVAGRDWKNRRKEGGDEPDCFSDLYARVLVVKVEDLILFLDFFEVLLVKCIATEYN